MKKLKILFVGDTTYDVYVRGFYETAKGMDELDARLFDYGKMNTKELDQNVLRKTEVHFANGIYVALLNRKLLCVCKEDKNDIIFLYSCRLIYGHTVKRLRATGAHIAVYCNDDPFSAYYKKYMWNHCIASMKYADRTYVYRKKNVKQAAECGAREVSVLLPYYMRKRNYYIPDDDIELDVPDVVYIGHDEEDGREEFIKALLNAGVEVGLNSSWKGFASQHQLARIVSGSKKGDMENYNAILNKAKIAIVFLSTINSDTYTRRCFEIPATKTLMVAPFTDDLAAFFQADKEAVFYRNIDEFVERIKYYLNHEDERRKIGQAGYGRVMRDGQECADRILKIVEDYFNKGNNQGGI